MSTSAPAVSPILSTFDLNTRVDELFAEHGFAKTNDDGDIVRDKTKVVNAIVDTVVENALANDPDERVDRAITKEDLYKRIFPNGPSLHAADLAEREVADYAATYVWSMTSPSYDGRVQRELGDRQGYRDLVLCRRKIGGLASIYVTRTDDLIVDDYVMPASEKLVKAADKTRRDLTMAVSRRQSLEARVQAELESTASKTAIALGLQTPLALNSGK